MKANPAIGLKVRLACGAAALATCAVPAFAQNEMAPDEQAEEAPAQDEAIVVTGSRIAREDYTAPTPSMGAIAPVT